MVSKSHQRSTGASQARSARWVGRRGRLLAGLAAAASGALVGALALTGSAAASPAPNTPHYSFQTLNNSNDPTFNQLLGINDSGVIAGYFGSGAAGHPNKGYYLLPRYTQLDYRIENFPGSVQTQVTGLNNGSTQVGFFAPTNTGTDANFGWYSRDNGRSFHEITVPGVTFGTPSVTQLLGVNDSNKAVGFFVDGNGNSHGFIYGIRNNTFTFTNIAGATSVTDAGINDRGDVTGFFTISGGAVASFLKRDGQMIFLKFPGASSTMALGVNVADEVVGVYTVGSGTGATMHGFTWTRQNGFQTVDDPNGVGTTTVNGVNDRGDLVGFYVDSAGNTDGMLATRH
jgi:hypothetical protein